MLDNVWNSTTTPVEKTERVMTYLPLNRSVSTPVCTKVHDHCLETVQSLLQYLIIIFQIPAYSFWWKLSSIMEPQFNVDSFIIIVLCPVDCVAIS